MQERGQLQDQILSKVLFTRILSTLMHHCMTALCDNHYPICYDWQSNTTAISQLHLSTKRQEIKIYTAFSSLKSFKRKHRVVLDHTVNTQQAHTSDIVFSQQSALSDRLNNSINLPGLARRVALKEFSQVDRVNCRGKKSISVC